MTTIITTFFLALILAWAMLPLVAVVARKVGLVDKPDNTRKLHKSSIPLVGGIVVFLSVVLTVVFTLLIGGYHWQPEDSTQIGALLLSSILLVIVGIVDDRFGLRGRQKLAGQVLAVTVLIVAGYQFDKIVVFVPIRFGVFSFVVVYAWCLIAINSVNLLDGADGFAATIGIIASLAMAVLAYSFNYLIDATICLAMAGALLGFLRYNFPPAKAFLGDTGSMLIGLVLSAIAIRCTFKQAVLYAAFAPIALLAIPLIDTTAAIIRRRFTGRSIYAEDRGHLHHVLAKRGLSPVASLIWVAALCTTTAVGGTLAVLLRESQYAIVSIALVVVVMIAGRLFGFAESQLLVRKTLALFRSLFAIRNRTGSKFVRTSIQIQGVRGWEDCWDRLCDFAGEHGLNQITLDVNAPWMHEAYHADWKKSGVRTSPSQQWQVELPLIVTNRILGRVTICADRNAKISHHDTVVNLLKLTGDIEASIQQSEQAASESGIIRVDDGRQEPPRRGSQTPSVTSSVN